MRGSVILMHDGGGDRSVTVQSLPVLIDAFAAGLPHMPGHDFGAVAALGALLPYRAVAALVRIGVVLAVALAVGGAVAELGGGAQHADQEALPLDRPNQVTGEAPRSRGEAALAVGKHLGRGLDQVRGPLVAQGSDQELPVDLVSVG